ncbi:MAG: hypothetical protein AAF318_12675 [Pseudomonadota bacterium]
MTQTAATRFEALNGERFSAAQVCFVTDVPPKSLTNWIGLNNMFLVSDAPGRGKPRKFCLVDIYIVGLVAKITELTANPVEAIKIARMRTLDPVFRLELDDIESATKEEYVAAQQKIFPRLCDDVRIGEPWMYEREGQAPSFLLLLPSEDEKGRFFTSLVVSNQDWNELLPKLGSGVVINLTRMCEEIDERLHNEVFG